jgi:hypothetical protein
VKKFLLFACAALTMAADKDFNGRWNLKVENEARARVWWLEVNDAGSAKMNGKFVGAPGGQVDVIPKMEFQAKELHWYFEKAGKKQHYSARYEKNELIGKAEIDGKVTHTFRGVRAPEIRDRDDERWKRGTPVDLFNGKDLNNWISRFPGSPMQWSVENGVFKNAGKVSDIRTKETFWNFELHAEYRYEKGSNSGIALRGRYEIQIEDSHGRKPDVHSHGALYSRIAPAVDAANPPAQWQTLDIRIVGRYVTVKLNGKTVIDKGIAEGLTAMGFDADEAQPGPLSIQGDHGLIEFRKFTVTPLVR